MIEKISSRYRSNHAHLWREAFIALFDDPRHISRALGVPAVNYDWKGLFVNRMTTQKFMRMVPSTKKTQDQVCWIYLVIFVDQPKHTTGFLQYYIAGHPRDITVLYRNSPSVPEDANIL